MRNTSGKLAAHPLLQRVNPVQVLIKQQSEDGFYAHLQHIWHKVRMLQDLVVVENEHDKFHYAYRFAEVELEKVCQENASLRERMKELLANQ